MKILFSPQSRFDSLSLHREGDALTINGETLDFSALGEGQALPAYDSDGWEKAGTGHELITRVARVAGRIEATVVLPYWGEASEAVLFPEPVEMDADGPVPVPGVPND